MSTNPKTLSSTVITPSGALVYISRADLEQLETRCKCGRCNLYGREVIGAGSRQQETTGPNGRPLGYGVFWLAARVLVN